MRIILICLSILCGLPILGRAQVLSVEYAQTITHQDRNQKSHIGQGYDIAFWYRLSDRVGLGATYGFRKLPYRRQVLKGDTLGQFDMIESRVHSFGFMGRFILSDLEQKGGWELHLGQGGWSHKVLTRDDYFNWFTFTSSTHYYESTLLSTYGELGIVYYHRLLDALDGSIAFKTTGVYDIAEDTRWTVLPPKNWTVS